MLLSAEVWSGFGTSSSGSVIKVVRAKTSRQQVSHGNSNVIRSVANADDVDVWCELRDELATRSARSSRLLRRCIYQQRCELTTASTDCLADRVPFGTDG
jgi:hypothetical protein